MIRNRITFRTSLVLLLTLLITLSSGLILLVSYVSSRTSVEDLAGNLIESHAARVVQRALQYLGPAADVATVTRDIVAAELLALDPGSVETYFRRLMASHPQFAMLNLGQPDGTFTMLKRMPDGSFSLKRIHRTPDAVHTTWTHDRPEAWSEAFPDATDTLDAGYDPRARPWYTLALEAPRVAWTDVYLFFTDRSPGITCAVALRDGGGELLGVLGIDIELSQLSFFLGRLHVGRTGEAFILSDAGEVVAMPAHGAADLEKLVWKTDGGASLSLTRARDFDDGRIRTVASEARVDDTLFAFEHAAVDYLGMLQPFPTDTSWSWRIAVVVPEDDFMGAVKRNNVLTIIVSLGLILIAVVSGVLLARTISRPLSELSHEMERVKDFELDHDVDVRSRIDEVVQMSQTFTRMKQGLRSFQKYVPRALVRELVRVGEEASLGGRKQELTILFSDIAGFTTFAERVEPEVLFDALAEYFSIMSTAIQRRQGTIDKFIGDAVMAFWGAPGRLDDHPLLACRAALEARRELDAFMARRHEAGLVTFGVRLGLNTGEVIVGNIGSEERLSYTALGDTVNIASRLEGLNKVYGTTLLIGADTYERVQEHLEARLLDRVAVKGRAGALAIYELLGERDALPDDLLAWRDRFEAALDGYHEGRFEEALEGFERCASERPEDRASTVFVERCRAFLEVPPEEAWDGVFVARTK